MFDLLLLGCLWADRDQTWREGLAWLYRGYGDNFTILVIYHQFVWARVKEQPHWQGASVYNTS